MRIGVLNDIHGNLPALEAILAEIGRIGVDRIVVGGDVVPGPMPHLVLERLQAFGVPVDFIYGNGEVAVIFTPETSDDLLIPVFEPAHAAVVVCGHTHIQFDRHVGETRVVNAGSVGMPFGRAGADWLTIGPDVELQHTDYDLEAAAEQVRRSGYPAAEEFATNVILNPPSTSAMMALFAKHELKS